MHRCRLTREGLTRAVHLLDRAPRPKDLDRTLSPIVEPVSATVTPELDEHLVAVGERARRATSKAVGR